MAAFTFMGSPGCGPKLDNAALRRLNFTIHEAFGWMPGKTMHDDVVLDMAGRNKFNPVQDYFNCLTWDRIPRLDNLFGHYFDAEPLDYLPVLSASWLIALVRRNQHDMPYSYQNMPVLQSPQGNLKGLSLKTLSIREEWYGEGFNLGWDDKTVLESAEGKLVIEYSELADIRETSTGRAKVQMSKVVDRARMAYDRLPTERPRRFGMIGTVNQPVFLKDPTGNRRYYPVPLRLIRLDELRQDRDQIWAEAVFREKASEGTAIPEQFWKTQTEENSKRLVRNEIQEVLVDKLGELGEGCWISRDTL
jgi:predicted P-loop ATPase